MSYLLNQIIRLAHENPAMREKLLPLVNKAAKGSRSRQKTTKSAAADSYRDFLQRAEKDFLQRAAAKIQKAVGSRGKVRLIGQNITMLDYKGTDTSDHPMEFTAALIGVDYSKTRLVCTGKVMGVSFEDDTKFPNGNLTPELVFAKFQGRYRA